jgi:hypothetical protein
MEQFIRSGQAIDLVLALTVIEAAALIAWHLSLIHISEPTRLM